jgi:putative endonuclease
MASGYFGTLYVGVTSNLPGRVLQHRQGTFRGFTERYAVKRLVWYEATDTMADAIASEKRLKRWRRDWKIDLIEQMNPLWHDLGPVIDLPRFTS